MVKTGLGIRDIHVCKNSVVWPFQTYHVIDLNPRNFSFELHHMSKERVPFNLPISLTVAPYDPDTNATLFRHYARKMTGADNADEDDDRFTPFYSTTDNIESTVKSVANGEIRVLSASRSIEEMFSDRKIFRSCITDEVQKDLDQFGLQICNANIEEMKDLPGSSYFEFRKRRAIESANNEARVDVAEAFKRGEIWGKGKSSDRAADHFPIRAETIEVQNEQELKIASSIKLLEVQKAQFEREISMAKIEAAKRAELLETDLQRQVEEKRVQQELQALR